MQWFAMLRTKYLLPFASYNRQEFISIPNNPRLAVGALFAFLNENVFYEIHKVVVVLISVIPKQFSPLLIHSLFVLN